MAVALHATDWACCRVFPCLRWKNTSTIPGWRPHQEIKAELMLSGTSSTFYLSCHFNSHPCFVQRPTVTVPPHKSAVILFLKSITKLSSKLEASPSIIRISLPHSWVVKRAHKRKTLKKEPYSWLNEDSFSNSSLNFTSSSRIWYKHKKKTCQLQLPGAPQPAFSLWLLKTHSAPPSPTFAYNSPSLPYLARSRK